MTAATPGKTKADRYRSYALGAVLFAMLAYFGGQWLIDRLIQAPLDAAARETQRLTDAIEQRETSLAKIRAAGKLLEQWETQSLPADPEVARSLYQAWLVELIDDVGLASPSVTSSEPTTRKGLYHAMTFSVRGRGTLDQLTRFLFAVYQTDLLHQVRSLTITPLQRVQELDVALSIEALALIGAGKASPASQESVFEEFRSRTWRVSQRLAFANLEDYQPIVERNLLGMGGSPDSSDFTFVTAINEVDGKPQVWFTIRSSDEVVKRSVGESLQVGSLELEIVEAFGSEVIVAVDGERWLLTLGDKITDAHALPPNL